jgi:hypothetical protein
MPRNITLIRVEQLLDIFHDGFHKLFGSPERKFKKSLKEAQKQALSDRRELARRNRLKELAKAQDARLEFEKMLKQRQQVSDKVVRERIDGLEREQSELTHDNDIEL